MARVFLRFDSDGLNKTLVKLSGQLTDLNLQQLIFLCKDDCYRDCTEHKYAMDLFNDLLRKACIRGDDVAYLAEILWRICRKDLVKTYLVSDVGSYETYFKSSRSRISPYRIMLHELCEAMVERTFKRMKDLLFEQCMEVSEKAMQRLQEPQNMFDLMEKLHILRPSHEQRMITMVVQTDDSSLYDVLVKHHRIQPRSSPSHQAARPVHHETHYPVEHYHPYRPDAGVSHQRTVSMSENAFTYMHQPNHAEMRHINRSVQNMGINKKSLQQYKMTSRPRGICVIISNIKFHVSAEHRHRAKALKKREGGEQDLALLVNTWQQLHFEVMQYSDLNAQGMMRVMYQMGHETDHRDYDMFVCCILSHGANGKVYGSDGLPVDFKDMVNQVKPASCPSLTEKPKVFFVQACQGRDKQGGYVYESESDIETDHPSFPEMPLEVPNVPNEADILISYATVPGFVSYRSKSSGSFYIKALCECLDEHAGSHDLMSILIEVNNRVSQMNADLDDGTYKQVPQPQTTLRKAIYFH